MKRLLRKGFKGEKTAFTVATKELEEDSDDVFGDGGDDASDDDDDAGDDDDAPLVTAPGSESDQIQKAESTTSSTAASSSVALVASKKKAKKSTKKKTQVVRKVSAGTRKTWCCVSRTDSTIHEASQSATSFRAVWESNKSSLRGRRSFSSKKKKKSRWKQ